MHLKPNSCFHGKEVLPQSRAGLVSAILEDYVERISWWWIMQSCFHSRGYLATEQGPEWFVQATVPGAQDLDELWTVSTLQGLWAQSKPSADVGIQLKSAIVFSTKLRQLPRSCGARGQGRKLMKKVFWGQREHSRANLERSHTRDIPTRKDQKIWNS